MIKLIAIVQCDITTERCPGFFCDRAFVNKTGGFEKIEYGKDTRKLNISCGGCCGKATHRKLSLLAQKAKKFDNIEKDEILVKLASCITKDNYHGPKCPNLGYIKKLIGSLGMKLSLDTHISKRAEERRQSGVYEA
jgi:predicted metal-binding protein